MVLLTALMGGNPVQATTEDGKDIVMEGVPHVQAVCGLDQGQNFQRARDELDKRARYDTGNFYYIGTPVHDGGAYAIPFTLFMK